VSSAIITGGGSGIGRAVALGMAAAGWQVLIAGRRESCLAEVCGQNPANISYRVADVCCESDVITLFDSAEARMGRIDLLFNNAGYMTSPVPVAELSLDAWQAMMAVNVTGAFLCARETFRRMATQRPQGGRIINNGSVSAHVPRLNNASYTTSKHAITGLTRSLSLEGRAFNIACGQIDIGNTTTELTQTFSGGALQADGTMKPEPMMQMDNVVKSVIHMASLPLDANVQFMTVMATAMPYIGRG